MTAFTGLVLVFIAVCVAVGWVPTFLQWIAVATVVSFVWIVWKTLKETARK